MSAFSLNGYALSRMFCEKYTAGNPLSGKRTPLLDDHNGYLYTYQELPRSLRSYKAGAYERRPPPCCRTASNGGSSLRTGSPTKNPPTLPQLRFHSTNEGVVGLRTVLVVRRVVMSIHLQPRSRWPTDRLFLSTQKARWASTPLSP